MRHWLAAAVLLAIPFAGVPATATADPVGVPLITGSATVQPGGSPLTFDVSGSNWTASGSWSDVNSLPFTSGCPGGVCSPGDTLSLRTTVMNDSLLNSSVGALGASATVMVDGHPMAGTTNGIVELLGQAMLNGGMVTLPPISGAGATLTAPFSVSGTVSGYNPFAQNPNLLFTSALSGTGMATINLTANPATGTYMASTVRYDFGGSTSPTPEPATWLLVGCALGLTWVATRRRRDAGEPA